MLPFLLEVKGVILALDGAFFDSVNRRYYMFFKKKCPDCGTNNPRGAATCASCGAPFEQRQVERPEALKDYDEAIFLSHQSAEAYYKRGFAYQKLGQNESAIEDFDKAISINPQFAKAYSNRAYAYLSKGQYDRTIIDCNKAFRLDPGDAVVCLNRGVAHKLQGNTAEAIADFEKAITLSENPQLIKQAQQQIKELSR